MKRLNNLLTAAALVVLFSAVLRATPVSENGALHVSGLQLMNSCGFPVQLRGVSTHGLQWNTACYQNTALLDFVANQMNADVVRIAMYVEQGGYINDPPTWTAYVDTLVDQIGARGMYAIIDWHVLYVSGQASGDPNTDILAAETFWQHEATQHKGKPYVIYEICNEPSPGSVTWAMISAYANDIIPKIRAIDPDSVIICGTPNWSQLGNAVVASPLPYSNLMYTFHFYAGSHNISMLTPYINSLPIFCTEWGPSDSTGNGGDNYPNATAFLNIMDGNDPVNNPAGVKISWAEWALVDSSATSSELTAGTCAASTIDLTNLSTAGQFVYTNINNPPKNFICGTYTNTPTNTPYAGTPTPTFTITPTLTPLPWTLLYDGDTAGYTFADGAGVANAMGSGSGTISEVTGGVTGNAMLFSYVSNTTWWEGHAWYLYNVRPVGSNNTIQFDIKAASGNAQQLRLYLGNTNPLYAQVNVTGSWTTVSIPLSTLYSSIPGSIGEIDFLSNWNQDYSELVDNIRLVCVPVNTPTITKTPTGTPTITQTRTVSPTFTITMTRTASPTFTVTYTRTSTKTVTKTATVTPTSTCTPTITPTPAVTMTFTPTPAPVYLFSVDVSEWLSYPNPTDGKKITFRYNITGLAKTLTINVYTFGERKIWTKALINVTQGIHTTTWTPDIKLANGLYYYTIEGTNGTMSASRHVSAFFVHNEIATP